MKALVALAAVVMTLSTPALASSYMVLKSGGSASFSASHGMTYVFENDGVGPNGCHTKFGATKGQEETIWIGKREYGFGVGPTELPFGEVTALRFADNPYLFARCLPDRIVFMTVLPYVGGDAQRAGYNDAPSVRAIESTRQEYQKVGLQ